MRAPSKLADTHSRPLASRVGLKKGELLLRRLFEVVYDELCEEWLTLLHEFQVLRMVLVFILSLFALELNVQRHLVRLIHNVAMAGHHLSDVEIHNTRD